MERGDARDVAALAAQLGYPASPDEIARRLDDLPGGAAFVALVARDRDGALAGWIHAHERRLLTAGPCAEIAGLVVERSHRRRGAGRALVEAVAEWARGRGLGALRVRSNRLREEAEPFYQRAGFERFKVQNAFRRSLT